MEVGKESPRAEGKASGAKAAPPAGAPGSSGIPRPAKAGPRMRKGPRMHKRDRGL